MADREIQKQKGYWLVDMGASKNRVQKLYLADEEICKQESERFSAVTKWQVRRRS